MWKFHVSAESQTVNLFDQQELCTHSIPNKVQLVTQEHEFKFQSELFYNINLTQNYQAEAVLCKGEG